MRKIIFVRHGKAVAAAEGQKDIDRLLGEVGIGQAKARAEKLAGVKFDLVLSSPAPRAHKTGVLVTGKPENEIVVVDALYPAPDDGDIGTQLDVLFNLLGYKPVADYLAAKDGDVLMDWAYDAHVMCDVAISQSNRDPEVVGVFGHAVCLPALGMVFCEGNSALVKAIEKMNLGECEGFAISFNENERPFMVEEIRG